MRRTRRFLHRDERVLIRTLGEDGNASAEVHAAHIRTDVIIRGKRTREVLGEKGSRIHQATFVLQKGSGFAQNRVERFAEMIENGASCAMAEAESQNLLVASLFDELATASPDSTSKMARRVARW